MTKSFIYPPPLQILGGACSIGDHTHRERDDAYIGAIVQFAPRWRLVLCKDQIQWIIQKKESSHRGFWRGKQYMTSKESVFEACGRLGLLSDANTEAVLHALPDRASDTKLFHQSSTNPNTGDI